MTAPSSAITTIGLGREAASSSLLAGRSGIGPASGVDTQPDACDFAATLGAIPSSGAHVRHRGHQLALLAAREAGADSTVSARPLPAHAHRLVRRSA